ncbi:MULTISPECIES: anti-sigma-F factor Fin family protein [Bacillus]|uniref:anti-sigma-F factor Fin family protein n=1 Tax=Bacillus TaxID=1386 RepID=UPI000305894D|nr:MULTISPECIES: anti-sigma-F factor Fin family protein [Bacillus]
MSVHYTCRHCNACLAIIPKQELYIEKLGLQALTVEEYQDFILYDSIGNIHVKIICEDCEEALASNPHLHGMDYIIQ